MTKFDFDSVMEPLVEKFGSNLFDLRKRELIFESCKNLETSSFRKIVNYFIGEDVRAKVSDFARLAKQYEPAKSWEDRFVCRLCEDQGFVSYRDTVDILKFYDERCSCSGGSEAFTLRCYLQRLENEKSASDNAAKLDAESEAQTQARLTRLIKECSNKLSMQSANSKSTESNGEKPISAVDWRSGDLF